MSNCNNCYNGCTETVSDQCVRYTGIDVPELGISTGDPLSVIEQSLTTFLVSTLNGSGVKIDFTGINICTVVQQYLPTCGELSIADISKALIQASCNIQDQIDTINSTLDILNADYTVECLENVTSSSDTHAILQATITKLCELLLDVNSLNEQLPLYVQQSELCTLVSDCINNNSETALASNKMLPYSVIPYYGPESGYPTVSDGFNSTGAGYGYWLNVYQCNGGNPGVPDLRGRVPVGATDMATAAWPTSGQTQPAVNGNPTYTYRGVNNGTNTVTLSLPQIPTHTHSATAITTIPPHTHTFPTQNVSSGSVGNNVQGTNQTSSGGTATTSQTTLSAVTTVTIESAGQGNAHPNYQPGIALYYLIYIPA